MSDFHKARLAQFWHTRVAPLLLGKPDAEWAPAFYEMSGWLNEGVFCGHFDRNDADFVWIRIKQHVKSLPEISVSVASYELVTRIRELHAAHNPFREAAQMLDGIQRRLEEPLMPFAMMLSDRIATDEVAAACSNALRSLNGEKWKALLSQAATHQQVLTALDLGGLRPGGLHAVLAGYYRLLEHMEASRRFFECAERRAERLRADFDSYQQRIGALNAWRIPLTSDLASERLEQIGQRFDDVLLTAASESPEGLTWEGLQAGLVETRKSLKKAWTKHHLTAFLQTA